MREKEVESVIMTKSDKICNVTWAEIFDLIKTEFENSKIKIIICTNKIEFVKIEERDKIFNYTAVTLAGSTNADGDCKGAGYSNAYGT